MCEQYETYTVKVDSRGVSINNMFTGYFDIPLRNVVKAELLSASLTSNTQTVGAILYVYVDELVSKFNTKTKTQTVISVAGTTSNIGPDILSTTANIAEISTSFASFPTEQIHPRTVFTTGNFWNIETEFIEPIRTLSQLTIKIYSETGELASLAGTTFLTFRFTCAKKNVCNY